MFDEDLMETLQAMGFDFHEIERMAERAERFGHLLLNSKIITEEQLREAINLHRKDGGRIELILERLGYITQEKLVTFLSKQYNVPAINLSDYKIDSSVLKFIPFEIARKYDIMPIARVGDTLMIAMADPSDVFAIDDIKFMTGYKVEVVVAERTAIVNAMVTHYREDLLEESSEISKSWLQKKITLKEAETIHLVKDDRLGPEPIPFGFSNDEWKAMIAKMEDGDELWEFCSSLESWRIMGGREGIALIRNGQVIDHIVTRMN